MKLSVFLMIITIFTKIFGLGRWILLSYFYGTGPVADAFLIAFFIPSLMLSGITLGIGTGFIPVYNEIRLKAGSEKADDFTNNLVNIVGIAAFLVSIVGVIFTEPLVKLFASGFEGIVLEEAIFFTRTLLMTMMFSAIAGVYKGLLQIKSYFVITVSHTIILNLTIMFSIYLSSIYGYKILGVGAAVGMVIQYIIFLPALKASGYKYNFSFNVKDKYVKKVILMTLPILAGVLVNEINLVIDRNIASSISEGAISALNYSSDIQDFVTGVIIVSIITVTFPKMSELAAKKDMANLTKVMGDSISNMLFLVIPATIGIMVFSKPIIRLLFGRGVFDEAAVLMTAKTLFYYSIGFIGIGIRELISRVFYSVNNTKTPVYNSIIMVFINIVLNIILSKTMGISGLALATSIANTIGAVLMHISLRKHFGKLDLKDKWTSIGKSVIASIIMAVISLNLFNILTTGLSSNMSLLITIFAAIAIYMLLGMLLKIEDALTFKKFILSKIK